MFGRKAKKPPAKPISERAAAAIVPPADTAQTMKNSRRKPAKTEAFSVRLTPAEKTKLTALAEARGVAPSRFVRRMVREAVTSRADLFADESEAFSELTAQVKKAGRGVNQIARRLNSEAKAIREGTGAQDIDKRLAALTLSDVERITLRTLDARMADIEARLEAIEETAKSRAMRIRNVTCRATAEMDAP